jgi:hypothetical protein
MADENKESTESPVLQQNSGQVSSSDMVTLPAAPDMSAQYAALDKVAKIYEDGMNEFTPLTKEQLEAERKRQSRQKIISAVGDGISAIANMVGTMNYAPNMYNAENSMSAKTQARIDKAKAEYDKRRAEHLNYALNYAKAVGDKGTLNYNEWKAKVENYLKQKKLDSDSVQAQAKLALTEEQTRKEKAYADKARTDADYEPQKIQEEAAVRHSTVTRNNASANASNASAQSRGGTFCGMPYSNDKEYNEVVRLLAKKYDIQTEYSEEVGKGHTTTKYVPLGVVAGEVLLEYNKEQEKESYKRK